ncbi:MAG TPA: hydantoinase/oxoprolinase family protein [Candidatus Binataceae bacterium]|nr:hydantoinase/oxoprolinase family protein [Candidatus Binataceae bacterium]
MSWRIGIDVGGTFTDLFAVNDDSGETRTAKVLGTRHRLVESVLAALARTGVEPASVAEIIHGSTTATNALIERTFPTAALITTEGFRDTIEIGRQRRERLYDPYQVKERPLIPRRLRFTLSERLSASGETVRALDEGEARAVIAKALAAGAKSIAVCFINAYVDGRHERRVRELIREMAPQVAVALSSETRPQFRELGRFMTTVVRAVLLPVMAGYLSDLERELTRWGFKGSLLIIKSNGGVMGVRAAIERPEELIESGPAGGVAYAGALSRTTRGRPRVIHTDMGGTSFDVAIVEDGEGLVTSSYELRWEMPIITPMLDIRSIGAGGGSIAWIDDGGSLRVGPRSAGSDPGPACYARGGEQATVTDANLLLGRLEPTLGGKMLLDRDAARRTLAEIGRRVGLDPVAAAEGIVSICTENMAQAIRLALAERGRDPRDFALVSAGGAGAMHACWIARSLGIPTVIVPAYAGVASAYGATRMDLRYDLERFFYAPLAGADPEQIEQRYRALEDEARALLSREGLALSAIRLRRTAQMRYVGQSYEVLTPIPDRIGPRLDEVRANFHSAHLREYGVASDDFEPAFVSLGVTAIGLVSGRSADGAKSAATSDAKAKGAGKTIKGEREVVFEGKAVSTPLYDAAALRPADRITGPAIIEHEHSCTVLPPGSAAEVDDQGNLLISV